MRFRPLDRTDASRVIQQTLYIRGFAVMALALCGLQWPDLALPLLLADIGIICMLFALADLFVAAAIRRESARSARKVSVFGFLGLGFGVGTTATMALSVAPMRMAVMAWLVLSGTAVMVWGGSLPRRERASGIFMEWGAVQLLLAFLLLVLHPTSATALRYSVAAYAAAFGGAQVALGLWIRRRDSMRGQAIAAV